MDAQLLSTRKRTCYYKSKDSNCGTHTISYTYLASGVSTGDKVTVTDNSSNHNLKGGYGGADIYFSIRYPKYLDEWRPRVPRPGDYRYEVWVFYILLNQERQPFAVANIPITEAFTVIENPYDFDEPVATSTVTRADGTFANIDKVGVGSINPLPDGIIMVFHQLLKASDRPVRHNRVTCRKDSVEIENLGPH